MGHTDTVNIDPAKWTHPPFGAVVADGYVYGRGTLALHRDAQRGDRRRLRAGNSGRAGFMGRRQRNQLVDRGSAQRSSKTP
jgi:hypothetical protein